MILKEKATITSDDRRIMAGDVAERQMTHYLKREFGKSSDCYVINDLRVCFDDEIAQIDHLLVTSFGFFIVESKAGDIVVTKRGDWERVFEGKRSGMPSPVNQAEAQGKILRGLLQANREKLRSKFLFGMMQGGFRHAAVEVFVAVSDRGTITTDVEVPELGKADSIPQRIRARLDTFAKNAKILSVRNLIGKGNPPWQMPLEDVKDVAEFLVANHTPLQRSVPGATTDKPRPSPIVEPVVENPSETFIPRAGATCPKCGEGRLKRSSVTRGDGTETDFLECSLRPGKCDAIYPLVALVVPHPKEQAKTESETSEDRKTIGEGDACPRCGTGRLTRRPGRNGKPPFFGCSNYRFGSKDSCRFMQSIET